MKKKIYLSDFGVSDTVGFLPDGDPMPTLSGEHECVRSALNLPNLLMSGRIRKIIEGLNNEWVFDGIAKEQLEEAMRCFSYLGHAYVWGEPGPVDCIPSNLARPWVHIATQLERPPVLSYASYALHNWRLRDISQPHDLNNIMIFQDFMAGEDEKWFIMIHVAIEAAAGPVISNLIKAYNFLTMERTIEDYMIVEYLRNAEEGLKKIYSILKRTPEHCDPYIYYHRVRPYIHGWMSKDPEFPYPDGIAYEGVDLFAGQKMKFRGETGAQSAIVPLLDALFSIEHENDMLKEYLLEMRHYLPKGHRALIEQVEKYPCIREYTKTSPDAKAAMDDCIKVMNDFRTYHLELAATYIHKQASAGGSNSTEVGTGGTPFMKYLKKHRDETV